MKGNVLVSFGLVCWDRFCVVFERQGEVLSKVAASDGHTGDMGLAPV